MQNAMNVFRIPKKVRDYAKRFPLGHRSFLGLGEEENVDRTPTHNTHLCSTVCSQAWNASHALGSSQTDCSVIFVRLKRICHLVLRMSHPCWLPRLSITTSTPSSSFTLLPTTTQEHAAQSVQQEQIREHPVHHAHLQAPSVDKLRHQESLWHENLQSGGNPRTTTPTATPGSHSSSATNDRCL